MIRNFDFSLKENMHHMSYDDSFRSINITFLYGLCIFSSLKHICFKCFNQYSGNLYNVRIYKYEILKKLIYAISKFLRVWCITLLMWNCTFTMKQSFNSFEIESDWYDHLTSRKRCRRIQFSKWKYLHFHPSTLENYMTGIWSISV